MSFPLDGAVAEHSSPLPLTKNNSPAPVLTTLRASEDFARCLRFGHKLQSGGLRFSVITTNRSEARLGIRMPRKIGNAVVRNRLRRWVREAFRLTVVVPGGHDVVVSPDFSNIPDSYQSVAQACLPLQQYFAQPVS